MGVRRTLASREAPAEPLTANHVRIVLTAGLVGALLFGADASLIEGGLIGATDKSLALDVHAHLSQGWHGAMSTLSFVGGNGAVFAVGIAAVVVFVWARFHKAAIVTLGAPSLALGMESALKAAFRRPRPHLWPSAETIHSFSFPSGHATGSAALAVALTWVAFRHGGSAVGIATAVLGCAFALGVGLSRVYLGVHWPSDIVGGYALASVCVVAVVLLTERLYPSI